jgi:alpha-mannosidase
MAETGRDTESGKNPAADIDIHEIMEMWRKGVKEKQRGIATFRERVGFRMDVIKERLFPRRVTLDDWQIRECIHRGGDDYEWLDAEWRPFRLGDTWGDEGTSAFMRRRAEVPEEFAGEKVMLRVHVGGDTLLRVDGTPYHGIDPFHNEAVLTESARGGEAYEFELESYVAWHAEKRYPFTFVLAELATVDEDMWQAWWDFRAVEKALDIEPIDPKLEQFLSDGLWEALKLVPLQEDDPERAREAIRAASEKLRADVYGSDRFQGEGLMHLVGHSHLDLVFMWPYREYVRKVGRTHSTMLRLMEQYPEFMFCQSQAKVYADMKEHWPDLYEQVKRRVAEGRWELIGAFWVEPDCNLISGESFVRQILYGQKFFEEEFGIRSRSCWQPDVFGLSWGMPQILARGGVEFFMTNKMATWNDTNPWRKHTFWWEGLDGSRVLAVVPPGHFIGTVDPDIMDRQWRTFSDKEAVGETLHVYGWGDGGGGPDAEMIECGKRYADFPGLVRTRFSAAEEAFDSIREKAEAGPGIPVWRDELYLEAHRGTYTNKALLKKLNRRLEFLYRDAELVSSLVSLRGAEYPAASLQEGWQDLLTTQFHDALPGTHVPEVEMDLLAEYEHIRATGEAALEAGLRTLFGEADAAGDTLVVFNPQLHARSDAVAVPARALAGRVVCDPGGDPLPQQRVTALDGAEKVLVRPGEVPPVGYRVLEVRDGGPPTEPPDSLVATADTLENELLRVRFSPAGEVVSLYDKELERELVPEGAAGNRFQMYEDTPGRYEAWDIAGTYVDHEIDLTGDASMHVDEIGPVRASVVLEKPLAGSKLRQRISLAPGSRELVFETEIDWIERQRLLKVAFPLTINAFAATYDIAFGNIQRPTHRNTSYDEAKFEVPANHWMDVSEADYGVSLLNDCKYGHEADGNTIRLTLLKGATHPDPNADKGVHHFTYVLYAHPGTWRDAGTNEAGLSLNAPLVGRLVKSPPEEPTASFIRTDAKGLTLEAVKQAEDGEGIIVRLVERTNALARGRLVFDRPVKKAWSTNLLEENETELEIEDGAVRFDARPYEIVTIRALF